MPRAGAVPRAIAQRRGRVGRADGGAAPFPDEAEAGEALGHHPSSVPKVACNPAIVKRQLALRN